MTARSKDASLLDWMTHLDESPAADEALRVFAHPLGVYLSRESKDQKGIAAVASIVKE